MACRSSQFHLLHVAVSEPCRLSEFTLSGPHKTAYEAHGYDVISMSKNASKQLTDKRHLIQFLVITHGVVYEFCNSTRPNGQVQVLFKMADEAKCNMSDVLN